MIDFASVSLLAILCASIAVLLAAAEIGHFFGSRAVGEANVSTLEAAILGLMALMIGFTFSMALSRFETRRTPLEQPPCGRACCRLHTTRRASGCCGITRGSGWTLREA
jgi:hypothetical protein